MSYTLQNSINLANTFTQYVPLNAGLGQEPAVSIASMIRSTILSAPLVWPFNRAEYDLLETTTTDQDYVLPIADMGFLEKATVTDSKGKITEVKEVQNIAPMSRNADKGIPQMVSILSIVPGVSVKIRFSSVPNEVYTVGLIYQKAATIMGPFLLTAAGLASAGKTTYLGGFNPLSLPVGSTVQITGFANASNNGAFVVDSCTATNLVVINAAGVLEVHAGYASNFDWAPLPDSYSFIYDSLFIAEAMAMVDDARAQQYRIRGIASLLGKQEGLSETQRNAFMQQWLARGIELTSAGLRVQQGIQGRGQ